MACTKLLKNVVKVKIILSNIPRFIKLQLILLG